MIGWVVGDLKARTGAHEVIVTIMLNYVMYNLLSYLLVTPTVLQQPHQANQISPNIASSAKLPARRRAAAAGGGRFPDRARGRGRPVVAAVAEHPGIRVPHRRG